MKTNTLTIRILFPVIAFMLALSAFAALRTRGIIRGIMDNYHNAIITQERDEILNIMKTDLTEEELLLALNNHFSTESFSYRVTRGEQVVVACCTFPERYEAEADGFLSANIGDNQYYGYRMKSEKYGLVIDVLRAFPRMKEFRRQLYSTVTVFSVSVLLMIGYLLVVVRRNLTSPLRAIMSQIKNGGPAAPTNIKELDELGEAANKAFATADMKNMHAKTLHGMAVALNENKTLEQIMDTLVGQSRVLIDAELSAIALYDEKGDFGKLRVYGLDEQKVKHAVKRLPRGEGILKLLKFSLAPVRIDDISSHPAFSGSFPEGHPPLRNFLGYPIFSNEGRPLAALCFANKRTGCFTVDDENILIAIASDAAVAIQRVRDTEELQRFKTIIETSFDAIIITDGNGKISYVNPAFQQVTGYLASEVLGSNPGVLKSGLHDSRFYADIWDTIRSGRPWKGEFVNKKKDGGIYNTSAVIFPVFSDSGEISNFVSIQRDMTEEKKLYEQLLRSQKMEAIGTLAGGIAHDFNNLLSAVIGYAEIIRDDLTESDPHYRHISIIESSAKRGADLAMRILNVTKKEELEYKVVGLNSVVEITLELLARSIPKDISIRRSLATDLPNVRADATQLQQVIMNLAVNARDAMPDGGSLTVETSCVGAEYGAAGGLPSAEGFVKLSISDTGKGMDEATAQKVFDPFFTTKARGAGTGLGLYIVHSIVTNHGGYINLYSEPGKGSRLNVYLPSCNEKAVEKEVPEREEKGGEGRVLVIEDEKDVRELTKDVLGRLGYSVVTANEGSEGIRTYREKREEIDLVVLDMIMPKMNGTEVFQILKTIDPEVRVVLVSGYSSEGFSGINRLLKNGAKGFVQKPFTQKILAKALREALEK